MTHVHEWTDAPDDESAWFCPGCGVTECGRCPYDPDAIRREAYEKVRAAVLGATTYRYILPGDDETTPTRKHQPFDMVKRNEVLAAIDAKIKETLP